MLGTGTGIRPLNALLVGATGLILGLLLGYAFLDRPGPPSPDPRAIADATLLSVRDEGRLVPFSARFAAVVSASQTHLGLTARKTLIMPANVRYGVDLSRLQREDVAWNATAATLTVTLPPVTVALPTVDPQDVQEFTEGGVLMALTGSEQEIDQENHRSAQVELMRQARAPIPIQMAQNAAMRSVARSFAIPLRAAGVDASVAVRLLGPSGREEAFYLDRPHRIEDVIRYRKAGRPERAEVPTAK